MTHEEQLVRKALEAAARKCERMRQKQRNYFSAMGSAGCPEYDGDDFAKAIRAIDPAEVITGSASKESAAKE